MWQRLQTKQPAVLAPPFPDGANPLTGNMYDLDLQQLLFVFDLASVEEDLLFCVMALDQPCERVP